MKTEISSQSSYTEIRLEGRFDHSSTREFRGAVMEAMRHGPAELRVDLAAVDYIDSAALGMLLMAKEMAETASKTVTLANAKDMVGKVLEFAKFKVIFKIV